MRCLNMDGTFCDYTVAVVMLKWRCNEAQYVCLFIYLAVITSQAYTNLEINTKKTPKQWSNMFINKK